MCLHRWRENHGPAGKGIGRLQLKSDGAYRYTPPKNLHGKTQFQIRANKGSIVHTIQLTLQLR